MYENALTNIGNAYDTNTGNHDIAQRNSKHDAVKFYQVIYKLF